MPEELQILDLPPDFAHHVQVLDLLPVEDLDSNLVTGQLVEADFHLAKGADAKGLAQDVMANLDLEKIKATQCLLLGITTVPPLVVFLASQDALEVMLFTD